MTNLGTIWVVINASAAQSQLVDFIDNGELAGAVGFSSALDSLLNKMKKFAQQYGGSIPICLYERIVMQLPTSAAEQLPEIIKGYSESLNGKVAVGLGLTMEEASLASQRSIGTGNIEMYDPEDRSDYDESFMKGGGMESRKWKTDVVLPPNVFDPTIPDEEQYIKETDLKQIKIPSIEEAAQGENKLIQTIAGQLGMDQMQQMQQQQEQQQQEQQEPPRDLLEQLNGGQVEGHQPEEEEEGDDESGATGEPAPSEGGDEGGDAEELEEEIDEAEEVTADDKIAMQLENIKGQIPQIMGLAQKDPKAFKQTMDMVNKLIQLAHSRSKTTKKKETRENMEGLIKAINRRASSRPLTHGHRYPVGTRLGRYKKVLIEGKEKWRELSSGMVKDNSGNPLSIKEHNKQANANQREETDDGNEGIPNDPT